MNWRLYLLAIVSLCSTAGWGADGKEARPQQAGQAYVVKPGDTLGGIAQSQYGNRCYAPLLAIHNKIGIDVRLKPEQTLKAPDLKTLLSEEGLAPIMGAEVETIMAAKTSFDAVEERLAETRRGKKAGKIEIPQEIKAALASAAENLNAAIAGLKQPKAGVHATPSKMIGQLANAAGLLKSLAAGSYDGYGYDMDLVHQHLAHAMLNGIRWAGNGYK